MPSDLTTRDLDELEALAKAATPGPFTEGGLDLDGREICAWIDSPSTHVGIHVSSGVLEPRGPRDPKWTDPLVQEAERTAAYLAACSPDRILALIQRARRAPDA